MGKRWDQVSSAVRNLPLQRKLLVSYLVVILVPLALFSSLSYQTAFQYYEDQVWFSADQSFDQSYDFLVSKLNNLVKASDIVYYSSEVQTALSRNRRDFEGNFIQQNIDMLNLDSYLSSFRNSEDIYRVMLWVPGWLSYADERISFDSMDRLREDPLHGRLFESKEKATLMPPEPIVVNDDLHHTVSVIPLFRRIRDVNNIKNFIGVIQINILEDTILGIIQKGQTTRDGLVFLKWDDGNRIGPPRQDPGLVATVAQAMTGNESVALGKWKRLRAAGVQYYFQERPLPGLEVSLVEAIPTSAILDQGQRLRSWLLILFLLIATVAYLTAVFITRSLSRRLNLLTAAMDHLGRPDLLARLDVGAKDEIGLLSRRFRALVDQIDQLLEAQYQAGQDLKTAELRALQAQINPHFLYNTLELINWQALNRGVPEIAEISRSLAKFYALSLNSGKEIVSLEQEVAHVSTYVEIQNRRFDHRIVLEIRIPKTCLGILLPKILLQPLVENSILHGILEKGEGHGGRVAISARREGHFVFVTVHDDGIGMSAEQVSGLLATESNDGRSGYGVKNVHERVRLYFGEDCGLSFRSRLGGGTLAVLKIKDHVRNVVR